MPLTKPVRFVRFWLGLAHRRKHFYQIVEIALLRYNSKAMKERSYVFDNLKALLIFCVVYSHFLRVGGHFGFCSPSRVIYIICFSFMMQGFFFVSGFFSKNVDKCRAKAFETFIIPYVVFMILCYFERYALFGIAHLHLYLPTHAMWFLLVMFYYRFAIKTMAKIPFILPISAILFLAAGSIPFCGVEMAFGRACSFLIFFMLGYYCNWDHIKKLRSIPKPATILPIAMLLAFSIWYGCQKSFSIDLLLLKDSDVHLGIGFAEGFIARIVVFVVSMMWLAVCIILLPDRKLPSKGGLITQIGQNTMTVFLLHVFVRQVIKWANRQDLLILEPGGVVHVLLMLAVALACLYLFSRPPVVKAYDKAMAFLYKPFGKLYSIVVK